MSSYDYRDDDFVTSEISNTELIHSLLSDIKNFLQKYDNQLWYVYANGVGKVYIGDKDIVDRVANLLYRKYKVEKYDITKHRGVNFVDAQQTLSELWQPKMKGDIIEYNGNAYKIEGFMFGVYPCIKLNDGSIIVFDGNKKNDFKLLHSAYHEKYKK